jgi:hypothetical protein
MGFTLLRPASQPSPHCHILGAVRPSLHFRSLYFTSLHSVRFTRSLTPLLARSLTQVRCGAFVAFADIRDAATATIDLVRECPPTLCRCELLNADGVRATNKKFETNLEAVPTIFLEYGRHPLPDQYQSHRFKHLILFAVCAAFAFSLRFCFLSIFASCGCSPRYAPRARASIYSTSFLFAAGW